MTHAISVCRRILLVRHGHYEKTGGLDDNEWGLTLLGRRQAVRIGRRLSTLVTASESRLEGVYTSPWPRAAQTAEIAAREMDIASVKIKRYLHEVVPIVTPGTAPDDPYPPGVPSTPEHERQTAHEQVQKVRGRFFAPPRRAGLTVLFTHGNLIRYLVARVFRLPYEAWARMDIAHTSVTEMRVYPSGFEALICFNETGHLPPSMITTS